LFQNKDEHLDLAEKKKKEESNDKFLKATPL
jgi:hypothetical protein